MDIFDGAAGFDPSTRYLCSLDGVDATGGGFDGSANGGGMSGGTDNDGQDSAGGNGGSTSAADPTQVANATISAVTTSTLAGLGFASAGPPGAVAGAIAGLALNAGTQGPTAFAGSIAAVATDLAHGAAIAATSPGIFETDAVTASNFALGGDAGSELIGGGGGWNYTLEVGSNGNFGLFVDQTQGVFANG